MVDSKQKGTTAENNAKKYLIEKTGLKWERIPMSGALDSKHGLKGDLYIPGQDNVYCVEIKHYKDCHITYEILTHKDPQLIKWWEQTIRESGQIGKEPMLIFKHDRSKWFIGVAHSIVNNNIIINKNGHTIYVSLLDDFLKEEKVEWVR